MLFPRQSRINGPVESIPEILVRKFAGQPGDLARMNFERAHSLVGFGEVGASFRGDVAKDEV